MDIIKIILIDQVTELQKENKELKENLIELRKKYITSVGYLKSKMIIWEVGEDRASVFFQQEISKECKKILTNLGEIK